jgi:hypothetical protein
MLSAVFEEVEVGSGSNIELIISLAKGVPMKRSL